MNRLRSPRNIYLLMGLGQGVFFGAWALAAMVWWVVDRDLSPIQLVLLGTVMELVVMFAESPTGVVADVFSRKWSIVIAWIVMGAAFALTPISNVFVLMLLWQALWGLGWTFQSGADTAWVTDEIGGRDGGLEDDTLIMAKAIAMAVGVVVGVGASIGLSQWSLTGAMVLSGIATSLFGLFLAAVMTEENFTPIDRSGGDTMAGMVSVWRKGLRLIAGRRVLRVVMIATFIMAMVDETVDRLDFRRMRELGFPDLDGAESATTFGLIWIGMTLLSIPAMVYVNRRSESQGDRRSALWMTGLMLFGGLSVGLMATNVFVLAIFGWVFRDVLRELLDPIGEAWVNRHASSDVRATVISFRSQSMAFGEVFGGLALGLVAEFVGLQAGFAAGGALLILAGLTVSSLLRSGPESVTPATAGAGPGGGAGDRTK